MGLWTTIKHAFREGWDQPEPARKEEGAQPATTLRLPSGDSWEVRGESRYQDALRAACPEAAEAGRVRVSCIARLEREPTNRYDPNAVKVLVDRRLVGYVPREHAEKMSALLEVLEHARLQAECEATICGRDGTRLLGIWLELASAMDIAHFLDGLDHAGLDEATERVERRRLAGG